MHKKPYRIFLHSFIAWFILTVFFFTDIKAQNAIIKEEITPILTYPYSDPNPVPTLAINAMVAPFYPYFVFDGYTDKGIKQDWKAVTLENDYIKVSILPGVGGKVWGAIEKSTGGEFV